MIEHSGLVQWVIRRHFKWWAWKCGYEDLLQVGYMGIMRAQKDWDPSRASFQTYAYQWVRSYIQRHASRHSCVIRLPVDVSLVRSGSVNRSPDTLAMYQKAMACEQLRADSEPLDHVPDHTDRFVESASAKAVVDWAMGCLEERKRLILKYRLDHTLEETADFLSTLYGPRLTRERIRQIEAKAIIEFRRCIQHFYPQYYMELVSHGRVEFPVKGQGDRAAGGAAAGVHEPVRSVQDREGDLQDPEGDDHEELLSPAYLSL